MRARRECSVSKFSFSGYGCRLVVFSGRDMFVHGFFDIKRQVLFLCGPFSARRSGGYWKRNDLELYFPLISHFGQIKMCTEPGHKRDKGLFVAGLRENSGI
eukprot:TRINITY_DN586_c0_g1_i1.p2 TRINITY_DN586_c0_g1~~TRINITY_DN586_c0_g1_i1.p2  ORF type:complete len:101 (-),score=5.38 TRINITY_DN586_c0_g1_i1:54-356(-)